MQRGHVAEAAQSHGHYPRVEVDRVGGGEVTPGDGVAAGQGHVRGAIDGLEAGKKNKNKSASTVLKQSVKRDSVNAALP